MHTLVPTATAVNFSDGLAAILVILAVYGLLSLVGLANRYSSFWRPVAIVLILGVFFVSFEPIRQLGLLIRRGFVALLGFLHVPELGSEVVLPIILILLIAWLWSKHQAVRDEDNKYMWLMLVATLALLTVSVVSSAVLWIISHAADALEWLQQLNF